MKLWFKNNKKRKENIEKDFVPLYPNDEDVNSIYVKRLRDACNDSKIHNIGVTGPYGSGKSSVIQSFLKGINKEQAYIVSLASFKKNEKKNKEDFVEELKDDEHTGVDQNGDNKFDSKDIEIGILQQIIYCIDSRKIPLWLNRLVF